MYAEHYTKTEDQAWLFREYEGADATLSFQSLDLTLPLADLDDLGLENLE